MYLEAFYKMGLFSRQQVQLILILNFVSQLILVPFAFWLLELVLLQAPTLGLRLVVTLRPLRQHRPFLLSFEKFDQARQEHLRPMVSFCLALHLFLSKVELIDLNFSCGKVIITVLFSRWPVYTQEVSRPFPFYLIHPQVCRTKPFQFSLFYFDLSRILSESKSESGYHFFID
jgi:hypothetical protein